ncbi:SIALI-17 repeat-containing surface protein [Streptococcus pneumoniae]|uniref:SIALI-17 repeat-containing surface protein n=3 Tax=Streptococcus pneumoniae TaxID=1313 RepID=UPI0005DF8C02|nr:SIALI-17 repeat-containing surface protein [Streptococcus pneumoniae]MDG7187285.1 ZmpA/ZmpB/ZmpC family metallo-endopeptidase [Streptococcus pneumoniae]MDG7711061.1 ZmpA/ZmpB/ZmpC family metallo-endopeptidase [Streptococcus pneumoniae]MDG8077171.1 ZmpA/ZmpB/ZmpC family metallo-endopeptidase [Streptococcus pneumoniae]MDG8983345.1 ZmpA/ZmpB/ZmpC family metallo-endopeptidase [Streptococcus pneumoniae]MDH7775856.1 ZmpA/ZmpB/ZmpC family metallo-endopeptidase [Streptococcus pneumoniae]
MSLFKKERFSIRKICGIVGSVLLGSILVTPSIIHASTYHYVEKSALTQEEQSKIQAGIPTDNEATYALIYQQEALPVTGSSTSVLTALGLLAVGSLVLLVHKKKKVSSLFLVTTIGLISLSSMQALDISNPLKAPSNEGVVQIAGYRYIGYLSLDDDAISEIQHKDEGTKNVPVSETQVSIPNEAPKAEKPKYTEPVSTVPDEAPKVEKPDYTQPIGANLVESEVHEKPEYTKPVGTVPDEAPKTEKPEYTEPVGTVPDEAPKADKPEYTAPVGTVPDETPKADKPEYTKPVGTVPDEAPKAEKPEYTKPVGTVPDEAPKTEKPEYTEPVGTVPDEAPKADKPEYTAPVGTVPDETPKADKPEYTKPVGTVPDEAPKADKPEYTAPVGTVPDEAPKAEKPEYTKPVGTVPDEATKADKPEYTEPVGTVPDEAPTADKPEYTKPVGTVPNEAPKAEKPEYTEPVGTVPDEAPKAEKLEYTAPVGGNLVEPEVQPALPEAVVTEKGEPEVQPTLPEAVVTEKGEPEVQPVLPEAVVTEKGEPEVQAELPAAVVTEKGEPEVQPVLPEAVVTDKGEPEVQAELPEYTTKVAPTLTLDKVTEDAMDRSAKLDYTLENTDNAEIKSIIAEIKDGNTVVKRVDLSKEKLTDAVQGLDLFKDYKIATTMTYNRGEGDETSKLDEKPLRLELKKVEIKNIASTNLVKVNDDGTETSSDFMTEKPSDEDVKKMYLKITSRDNKVTRLAVDSIEEVTEEGKKLYKITAEAQDLIQHTDPTKVRNKYVHYIEKPVPKVDNVYYNFKELVDAMNADKNGTFKIGADLNATNVPTPKKWYVDGDFRGTLKSVEGKHYTIHNTERPLFKNIIGGTVTKVNLGNVNINMPWADRIAPIADTIKGGAKIEDVKVTGNVLGRNWVSGFIDKIDNQGTLRNVAFIGNVTAVGDGGQYLTGIVGENWKGLVEKAYVDANLVGDKAKAAGIAYSSQNGGDNGAVSRDGAIKKSVAKGTINVAKPIENGGVVGSMKHHGSVEDSVSMMKVSNGEIFYGSSDIDYDDGYWTGNNVKRNYVVVGVSDGNSSYQRSKDKNRIKPISEEEAKSKIEATGISADKYEINEPIVNRLNRLTRKEDEYKTTQDYRSERDLAYRNIEKLQPFYNKEWIVNQGNKLTEGSNLLTKEVLSVTGMKDGQFVTDLSDIDHVMIHYADKTKEIKAVHQKESKVAQVREYSIDGLGDIVYTPNIVDKNRDQLIKDIKDRLATVELISPEVRALMGNRDRAEENTEERKNGYIRDLYLEESFAETKANLDKLVKSLIENADHQLNSDEAAMKALVKKVDENKAKIVMALTYLNRYYDIKYGDMTIKNLMMFKPDFYGKSVDLLDFLIRIGSSERNIKGDRTLDAYRDMIGGTIGKAELHGFLDYNMRLFTNDTDLNDWFIHAAKNVYVVEPKITNPDFVNKRHRAFDGLNNGVHNRMILPLLTLKNAHMFLISTYNTMAYSSFEKYGKYTEAEREAFKDKIKEVAHAQQTYLDFWSRLALPSVRDQLLKSQNRVPTPVWDNQNYHNVEGVNRMGYDKNNKPIAPIRELYGPTWKFHDTNWYMGAMASIFPNPNNNDQVYFMGRDMISPFGISAFTHETTHVNDRMLYFGGHRHRQGTDVEAYAQGMLQTPDKSGNGEYGALGLNMAYHRENDGDQWYNYNPDKLQTREDIDRYMKNYNEALMMLDHLEADAVIPKLHGNISRWFKKMDRQYRKNGELHQFDKVRELTEDEKKKIVINNIDDLVNNNLMTKHGAPSDRTYNPEDFDSAYVNINMMTGIYGGNTSQGAPGAASFKHNTFRMWGYFGYENGFISYASSKYQGEADKTNKKLLGDDFIIKKVSKDKFNNLEEWKKEWFKEVKSKAEKGFTAIEIDGRRITNYDELKSLFDKAVEEDLKIGGTDKTVTLKSKVFKALLKNTDGFFNPLFK